MRTIFAALLALALAGCATTPDAEPSPEDPGAEEARVLPWSMAGCRFGVALIEVPASAVQPFVPEGFRVLSVAETGAEGQAGVDLPNPRADGNLGFELFECDSGLGLDNATVSPMAYVSIFAGVEPPEDLRRDVQNHFVKWDVVIPDEARRLALAAAGLPVHAGNATVSTQVAGGAATSYTGRATIDGIGEFAFEGSSAAPLPDGAFVEYTQTPDGLVAWNMAYSLTNGGAGPQTVTIPDGAWFNEILPAGTYEGFGFSGIAEFHTGTIALPSSGSSGP